MGMGRPVHWFDALTLGVAFMQIESLLVRSASSMFLALVQCLSTHNGTSFPFSQKFYPTYRLTLDSG
jgi:hypothetical protein